MSRSSFYAIRALTYLACQVPGKLSGTRDIARHERIPGAFLGKVLQQLRRGRLLRSYRGIGGGYELALPPEKISLLAVLRCMEAASGLDHCVLEDRDCSCESPCALHYAWVPVQEQLLGFFENNTLLELVQARQPGPERKAPFLE
jgi:Rrf2 family protein